MSSEIFSREDLFAHAMDKGALTKAVRAQLLQILRASFEDVAKGETAEKAIRELRSEPRAANVNYQKARDVLTNFEQTVLPVWP